MHIRRFLAFFIGVMVIPVCIAGAHLAFAQSIEQLQADITAKNTRLSDIEKEIKQYEADLKKVGAEKGTLQKAISQLELEYKKIQADIRYTENKISSTDLEINKLTLEIGNTEKSINQNEDAIKAILRNINVSDNESMIEVLLRNENVSDFWTAIEQAEVVRNSMSTKVRSLSSLRTDLDGKRIDNTKHRDQLVDLKEQYSDQQQILTSNKAEKSDLLSATKSKESEYQKQLKAKKEAKEKLMAEVATIESQIKFILDPSTIPNAGNAVFAWPLTSHIITQYFGYTKFAMTTNAYKNNMHNGIDLGAPVGTKIFAPLTGTVRMTGNTDLVSGCYSWGKWALVDHPNGLSTLYAHMSQVAVTPGQALNTGDIIGYVGATGYATGPHLHFTVYVTKGVEVKQFNQFKAVTGCGAALSPFAAIEAYLNPMDYLPPI